MSVNVVGTPAAGYVPRWNPEAVADFWRFVVERHQIFVRRVARQAPPPWTDDPILSRGYFTNIYRELDRGTRYALVQILGRPTDPVDRLWNVMLYRRFNLVATHEALDQAGLTSPSTFDPAAVIELLLLRHDAGQQVFTGAFRVNFTPRQYRGPAGPGAKIRQVVERLTVAHQHLADLHRQFQTIPLMSAAHARLAALPGLAAFGAYQLLIDLTYSEGLYRFDDQEQWCAFGVGMGTEKGLGGLGVAPAEGLRAIRRLRDEQPALQGPPLTLANITNCLCEFAKYRAMRRGEPPKRTYAATKADPDLSPWPAELLAVYAPRRVPYRAKACRGQ